MGWVAAAVNYIAAAWNTAAAAISAYTGLSAAFVSGAMKLGIAYGASLLMKKSMGSLNSGTNLNLNLSSNPVKRIIYGFSRVGGDYVLATTSKTYWYDNGVYKPGLNEGALMHMLVEVAGHKCAAFEEFYLNGEPLNLSRTGFISSKDIWPKDPNLDRDKNGVYRFTGEPQSNYHDRLMFKLYPQGGTTADFDLVTAASFDNYKEITKTKVLKLADYNGTNNSEYSLTGFLQGIDVLGVKFGETYYLKSWNTGVHRIQYTNVDISTEKLKVTFEAHVPQNIYKWEITIGTGVSEQTLGYLEWDNNSPANAFKTVTFEVDNPGVTTVTAYLLYGANFDRDWNGGSVLSPLVEIPWRQMRIDYITTTQGLIDDAVYASSASYYYGRFLYDPEVFQGYPTVTVTAKGKYDIYDPRHDVNYWTQNPALITADYLTMPSHMGGLGESWSNIDTASLIDAANVCDEVVVVDNSGRTAKRYELNGSFTVDVPPADILNEMLLTYNGTLEKVNGKWHFTAGKYVAPDSAFDGNDVTITEGDLVDVPQTIINRNINELYNAIRPTIPSKLNNYNETVLDVVAAENKIPVTVDVGNDKFTKTGHGLINNDRVRLRAWVGTDYNDDYIPDPFSAGTYYYAVVLDTNNFRLSATNDGTPITITSAGSGVIALHDVYLTQDGERKILDVTYHFVTDPDFARRLAITHLKQSRQQIAVSLKTFVGTPYVTPYDLTVADTFRYIDNHKDFWEYDGVNTAADVNAAGWFTASSHGMDDGQPLVITDADVAQYKQLSPYYVINPSTNNFQIGYSRGGNAVAAVDGTVVEYRKIKGKLFKVSNWSLAVNDGVLFNTIDGVEATDDLYDYTGSFEALTPSQSGINVDNPRIIPDVYSFSYVTGTDTLYIRNDGTVASRVKLFWDESTSGFVKQGGNVEIQYRENPRFSVTAVTESSTFYAESHSLSDRDLVWLWAESSSYLPEPMTFQEYVVTQSAVHDFRLTAVSNGTASVEFTTSGSGLYIDPMESGWIKLMLPGDATQYYLTDLDEAKQYDVRARFRNSLGRAGNWTYIWNFVNDGKSEPPNEPTSFTASFNSSSYHNLISWVNPTDLDYKDLGLYRATSVAPSYEFLANIPKPGNSYIDTDISLAANDITYYYQAKAYDTTTNESNIVSASIIVDGIQPISNFSVTASSTQYYEFTATWSVDATDDWVVLQFTDYPDYSKSQIEWIKIEDGTSTFSWPITGSLYARAWRVKSINGKQGQSNPTDYVSCSINRYAIPNPISNYSASYDTTNYEIDLSWIDPVGAGLQDVTVWRSIGTGSAKFLSSVGLGIQEYSDKNVYSETNNVTYSYQSKTYTTDGQESEIASCSILINALPTIQNFNIFTSSLDFYSFTLSWDNDNVEDWIVIEYVNQPDYSDYKTEWRKVSDTSSSFDVPLTWTGVTARAWRHRTYSGKSVTSNDTGYVSSSIPEYGVLLEPLTSSITVDSQQFNLKWLDSGDNHPVERYDIYVAAADVSGSSTLIGSTTDTSYKYVSNFPGKARYFWIKKVSPTGEESDFSNTMDAICGWDMSRTFSADYSGYIIYDPPVQTGGVGQQITRALTFNIDLAESQSYAVGYDEWLVEITNNDTEEIEVNFQFVIYDETGTWHDNVAWLPMTVAAGSSSYFNPTPFSLTNEVNSVEEGWNSKVFVYAKHSTSPFGAVNNVTCSLLNCRFKGQIYDTPDGYY